VSGSRRVRGRAAATPAAAAALAALALALGLAAAPPASPLLPAARADEGDISLPDAESVSVADPPLEVHRPDKEWVFLDIARQRAEAVKTRPVFDVEKEFGPLRARLLHPSTKALVSLYAEPFSGAPPSAPDLVEKLKADVGRRPGAELLSCAATKVPGAEAAAQVEWAAKVEAPRPAGERELPGAALSGVWYYRRVDVVHAKAQRTLDIFFEVPKERAKKALPGFQRIVAKLKLR
jgi:hypothetical protein